MLSNVVAHYLDSVTEREFDAPFMALLAAHGFEDIHLLHGPFEFGKDVIAKRHDDGVTRQYAFQAKAGDLKSAQWREARSQVDEIRYNGLAHPSFDVTLPRVAILVCTGRLIGGAAVEAQQYKQFLAARDEGRFDSWDAQDLSDMLTSTPECGLAGGDPGALLTLIGAIDEQTVTDAALERSTRRWVDSDPIALGRASIECAVIAHRLRKAGRLDLAAIAALCLLRAARVAATTPSDLPAEAVADKARVLFAEYARTLWNDARRSIDNPDPLAFAEADDSGLAFTTYPVRCSRLIEILGLLGLLLRDHRPTEAADLVSFLSGFIRTQPGTNRPLSDRWAVSLLAPVLLLAPTHRDLVGRQLESITRWVADRYDDNPGLALPYATPDDEVLYAIGHPYDGIPISDRRESYLATVILDLAAILGLAELYNVALNDLLAAQAWPCLVVADERQARYGARDDGLSLHPQIDYLEPYPGPDQPCAPHHAQPASPDPVWDVLALSSLARDRHHFGSLRALLQSGQH